MNPNISGTLLLTHAVLNVIGHLFKDPGEEAVFYPRGLWLYNLHAAPFSIAAGDHLVQPSHCRDEEQSQGEN